MAQAIADHQQRLNYMQSNNSKNTSLTIEEAKNSDAEEESYQEISPKGGNAGKIKQPPSELVSRETKRDVNHPLGGLIKKIRVGS